METLPRRRAPTCLRILTVVLGGLALAGSARALRVSHDGVGPARGAFVGLVGAEDIAGVPASFSAVGDRVLGLGPSGAFAIDDPSESSGIVGFGTALPEPATTLLIGLGLAGLGVAGKRRDSPRS